MKDIDIIDNELIELGLTDEEVKIFKVMTYKKKDSYVLDPPVDTRIFPKEQPILDKILAKGYTFLREFGAGGSIIGEMYRICLPHKNLTLLYDPEVDEIFYISACEIDNYVAQRAHGRMRKSLPDHIWWIEENKTQSVTPLSSNQKLYKLHNIPI